MLPGLKRWIWAAAAVLSALVALWMATLLNDGKAHALLEADSRLRLLTTAAQSEVNRNLASADLLLAGASTELKAAMSGHALGDKDIFLVLSRALERQLVLSDLVVVDDAGVARSSGLQATRFSRLDLPDGLLAKAAAAPTPTLVVSDPVRGRATGERSLLLVRRLQPEGNLSLFLVGEVTSSALMPVSATNLARDGMKLSLERRDGMVLLTQPPDDHWIGKRRATETNPKAAAEWGVRTTAGELVGAPAREITRSTLYPQLQVSASWRETGVYQEWIATRTRIWITGSSLVMLIIAAATLGHWHIVRLTEARLQAARASELLTRAMNSMGDAFLVTDAHDRIVLWNERYLDYFPWLRGTVQAGVPMRRLAEVSVGVALGPTADQAQRDTWIERRMKSRGHRSEFVQAVHTGAFVSTVERLMPDGGIVSVYRDMSSRESALVTAQQVAEKASEAKSQFLANMSHEIRTPLNALLGLASLLLTGPLEQEQRQRVELIESSGKVLLTLVNDILDLSRIDAGRLEIQAVPADAARLTGDAVELLRNQAMLKGLALSLEIDNDVPPSVRLDPVRWQQVVLNLLGNAIKFTDKGGVKAHLRYAPVTGTLSLKVEDTGVGIPADQVPLLFQRFTQADSTSTRRHGGSGLGLAITRALTQGMGGDVEVQSLLGQGSVFTASVRCFPADPDFVQQASCVGDDDPHLRSLRVLVAEDHAVNQIVIEAFLSRMGHITVMVGDGDSAVQKVGDEQFDVVLMDLQMPGTDGLTATRAIRALAEPQSRIPIVAMTANARVEDREACYAAGMDHFLTKPVNQQQLSAALSRIARSTSRALGQASRCPS